MTNAELKTRFLIGYEFVANNLAPGYLDSEISGFLNQGMDLIVDELYANGNIGSIAEVLVKTEPGIVAYLTPAENYGNYAYWTVQNTLSDLRHLVNAKAKVLRYQPFAINSEWIECEPIDNRIAEKWVTTSINMPIIIYPKIVWHGTVNGYAVIFDAYSSVEEFQVMYIKNPVRIDVADGLTCELHTKLHQKIVDKAIALAMKATDAERAQKEVQINQAL